MACFLLLSLFCTTQAGAMQPDLTTTAAFDSTCADHAAKARATVREQQAYVICNDVALVQHVWTFFERLSRADADARPSAQEVDALLRKELTYLRDELRKSRTVLENIRIGVSQDGLLLVPSALVRDLNGDGEISVAERNFFAIPARKDSALALHMPSGDAGYYAAEYQLGATIRIDQADIYWSLGYHYFLEAVAEYLLAYQYRETGQAPGFDVRLRDAASMLRAQQLLGDGLRMSERTRLAVLQETDDDQEWIGNPRQASSVFPIPMDDEDFRIWGDLMALLVPLVEGRTLLSSAKQSDDGFGRCPAGMGLDIARLFRAPPASMMAFFDRWDTQRVTGGYCRKVDAAHPASAIAAFVDRYAERIEQQGSAAMMFLRRLLWVN